MKKLLNITVFCFLFSILFSNCNSVVDSEIIDSSTYTSSIICQGNLENGSSLTRTEKVEVLGNIKLSDASNTVIENSVYNEYGEAFTLRQTFQPTSTNNEYEMYWEIENSDGYTVAGSSHSYPLTIKFVDEGSGYFVLDASSKALFEVSSTLNVVSIFSAGNPGGEINFKIDASQLTNNDAIKTIRASADQGREPNIVRNFATVYDSFGSEHHVTLQYTKIDACQWRFVASVPGTSTSTSSSSYSTGIIKSNSDGNGICMISPNDPYLSFTPATGADPLSIELNFYDGLNVIAQTSTRQM